jgi:predicted MFS family arabinose efflux permease
MSATPPGAPVSRKVAQTVAVLLALLTLYVWDRVVLAVSLPEIRTALGFTPHQTGLVASAFAAGVALVALPAGLLVRRIGFRPVMVCSGLIFSLATAYPPLAHGYWDLLASRLVVGLGEGVFNVSLLLYLGSISQRHRAALIGLGATVFGIAASVGPPLIHMLDGAAGTWRISFYGLAVLGVLLCVPLMFLAPAPAAAEYQPGANPGAHARLSWSHVLAFWPLLILVGAGGLAIYSVTGLLPTWTRDNFGFSATSADLALGAVGVGLLLGGAPLGLIADRFNHRHYAFVVAVVSALSVSALMTLNLGPLFSVAMAVVFGAAANSLYVTAIAIAQESAGPDSPPLVGLVATVFYGSAFVSGPLMVAASERLGYQTGALTIYALIYTAGLLALVLFHVRERARPVPRPS